MRCASPLVAVAGQRVGAAAELIEKVRPDDAGFDMHRCNFGNADADFVLAEPRAPVADDRLVRDLDDRAEQMISARPPACLEQFCIHTAIAIENIGLGNLNWRNGAWILATNFVNNARYYFLNRTVSA